ncbi:hypothetical protein JB92DRAFT_81111 [Gautieria morchelliformis]|nr:hypothetical protein JB92DRAFT_81111 [Gautieria morchelliformis]
MPGTRPRHCTFLVLFIASETYSSVPLPRCISRARCLSDQLHKRRSTSQLQVEPRDGSYGIIGSSRNTYPNPSLNYFNYPDSHRASNLRWISVLVW